MKIAVYAIAKNEIDHVDEWYESVKNADGVFVLDTGSTDKTASRLQELGVHCNFRNMAKTFRFDHARNEALSYVPADYDVCISIDLDERLQPDWREVVEREYKGGVANYTLVFDYDDAGNIVTAYPRAAIHERNNCLWQYPVHEVLTGRFPAYNINILCVHAPLVQKPAGHYLELLKLSVVENPNDARAHQYLAREYFYLNNWQQSLVHYQKHLDLCEYAPDKTDTYIRMGLIAERTNQDPEPYYYAAIAAYPYLREPYCVLSEFYFSRGVFQAALGLMDRALRIEKPEINFVFREDYYSFWCHHMAMACYLRTGQPEHAKTHMMKAFAACGEKINKRLLQDAIEAGFVNVEGNSPSV